MSLVEIFEGENVVTMSNVIKKYGKKTALDDVNLRIPRGAVYLLVGPNGSGKTTTLRLLLDQLRPTAGSVTVFGSEPRSDGARIRSRIGYMPEDGGPPYHRVSNGDILELHASYYDSWRQDYANKLVDALSIDRSARFDRLSKGEKRRVMIVMALAHTPDLLVLDEPTDGLDPVIRDRFFALLVEHLAEYPASVLLSTHRVYESELLADHVGVLSHGKLTAQLRRSDIDTSLRRYSINTVSNGGAIADGLDVVRREQRAGAEDLIIWGQEDNVRQRLADLQVETLDVRRLSLEETARALMEQEVTS